jgi:hypothetical protein
VKIVLSPHFYLISESGPTPNRPPPSSLASAPDPHSLSPAPFRAIYLPAADTGGLCLHFPLSGPKTPFFKSRPRNNQKRQCQKYKYKFGETDGRTHARTHRHTSAASIIQCGERGMELPGKNLAPASFFMLSRVNRLLSPGTRLAASRLAEGSYGDFHSKTV